MRFITLLLAFTACISVQAQLPPGGINYTRQGQFSRTHLLNDSTALQKKWSVSMYGGMAAGVGFFSGGTAFFPLQVGLQLNRRLSNNLYAFAGVSTSPVLFNFNRSFNAADLHTNYMAMPVFNSNGMGVYTGLQAGLMYVNDEKTFSISGSIGISHSSYPYYPYNRVNTQKQPAFTGVRP